MNEKERIELEQRVDAIAVEAALSINPNATPEQLEAAKRRFQNWGDEFIDAIPTAAKPPAED